MSLPFGSIENPFAKPVLRSKNTTELIGKILGPEQEIAFREALGSTPDDLDIAPDFEAEPELTNRERLELTYNLTEQYEREIQSLRDRGLIETDDFGVEFIRGIDARNYPLLSLETIANRLLEQKEKLDIKAEQGFIKLILVPFAVSLDRQIASFGKFLLDYKKKHPDFVLNEEHPEFHWWEYNESDETASLVYDVKKFSKDEKEHHGLTKKEILKAQRDDKDPLKGWRIELLQEGIPDSSIIRAGDSRHRGIRNIPRAGNGRTDGKTISRREIEAGKTANEYLIEQLSWESGMTPEDWICAFVLHVQETGKPLDDWSDGKGSLAFLTGTYLKNSMSVPGAYWEDFNQQAFLRLLESSASQSVFGSRFVVRI